MRFSFMARHPPESAEGAGAGRDGAHDDLVETMIKAMVYKRLPLRRPTGKANPVYSVLKAGGSSGPKGLKTMMSWGRRVRAARRAASMANPVNRPK